MRCETKQVRTTTAGESLALRVRSFGGARAQRLTDAPDSSIAEHAHDWPVLSIYVAGSLENRTEAGTCTVRSPWIVLYGAGAAHSNNVGPSGFEQLEIEFDPAWLKLPNAHQLRGANHWVGGRACLASRRLVQLWCHGSIAESSLTQATREFVTAALEESRLERPRWADSALTRIEESPGVTAAQLASEFDLNPQWLAQAYRRATGEGIRETGRRLRVEKAAIMMRTSNLAAADVAAAAGFCDQSHMIRCFLRVLGRTPCEIRREWQRRINLGAS